MRMRMRTGPSMGGSILMFDLPYIRIYWREKERERERIERIYIYMYIYIDMYIYMYIYI